MYWKRLVKVLNQNKWDNKTTWVLITVLEHQLFNFPGR